MIRVLEIVDTFIDYGGIEAFVIQLMENLDRTKMQVDCLTPFSCRNSNFRERAERNGITLYELNLPLHKSLLRNESYSPVKKFLTDRSYDVIHIHSSAVAGLSVLAAAADQGKDTTILVHSHVTGESFTLPYRILRFLASFSMKRHVDVYCACSSLAAEWKYTRPYQRRAVVIRNGIETEKFQFRPMVRAAVRQKLGFSDSDLVIGHVGRLESGKNQEFLIRIFERIAGRKQDAWLMLVGGGTDRPMLEEQVKQAGLEDRVLFIGEAANVPDYLMAMDVFVFPSVFEAFGLAVVEAQAAGLPVISSDRLPKEVKMTENLSFLPLEDDPEKWADAILRAACGAREQGAEKVRQAGYDMQDTAKQVNDIYLSALSRHPEP